jgi:uncharacterized protein YcaQ
LVLALDAVGTSSRCHYTTIYWRLQVYQLSRWLAMFELAPDWLVLALDAVGASSRCHYTTIYWRLQVYRLSGWLATFELTPDWLVLALDAITRQSTGGCKCTDCLDG